MGVSSCCFKFQLNKLGKNPQDFDRYVREKPSFKRTCLKIDFLEAFVLSYKERIPPTKTLQISPKCPYLTT